VRLPTFDAPAGADVDDSGFATAFDAALRARDLTLSRVRDRLSHRGVALSLATLSYWRSGVRRPDPIRSADALDALEAVLDVVPGTLTGHLGGHSRRLGAVGRVDPQERSQSPRTRMLRRLCVAPPERVRTVSIQETIDISPDLRVAAVLAQMLVQCVQGTIESLGFVEITPRPTSVAPVITVMAGGAVDLSLTDATRTVFGHRLRLDKPLSAGETAMVEMLMQFPESCPARRSHLVVAPRRVRELLQWYRFAEGAPPDWFEEDETTTRTRTSTIFDPESLHRSRVDFGPGQVLARWGYVDDF